MEQMQDFGIPESASHATAQNCTIRPFAPERASDYEGISAVRRAVLPDYPRSAAQKRAMDGLLRHYRGIPIARWVAERDGRIVGVAGYQQDLESTESGTYEIRLLVHPAEAGQGIGSALFTRLLAEIAPMRPQRLRALVREDATRTLAFAHARGFTQTGASLESLLDVRRFPLDEWAGAREGIEARLAGDGITFATLAELAEGAEAESSGARGSAGSVWERQLYALDSALVGDVLGPEVRQPASFDVFRQRYLASPHLLREGYIVARAGEKFVGVTSLWTTDEPGMLEHTLTGVLPAYRRQGIALALKLRSIAYASRLGYRTIRTWSDVRNEPMIALNRHLGYVARPPWLHLELHTDRVG